jgi:hypothetical protein
MEFGKQTSNFKNSIITELLRKEDIEGAKKYVNSYIIKIQNPMSIIIHTPSENKFSRYSMNEIKSFLPSDEVKLYNKVGNKLIPTTFNIKKWFNSEVDFIIEKFNPTKPAIYNLNDCTYFNSFVGHKFKDRKIYNDYDITIKNDVNKILNHILNVWCSGNENQYSYVMKWISCSFVRKLQTCLYLKSTQGTGKSIITEFLYDLVGSNSCIQSDTPERMLGQFNGAVEGKTHIFIEEFAVRGGKSQWMAYNDKLKSMITGKYMEVECKGIDSYQVENHINMIILTNNQALKLDEQQRRIVALDISSDRVGDSKYFDEIVNILHDEKIQEAFYWYCRDIADSEEGKNFKENIRPTTKTNEEICISNLHPHLLFIKLKYVMNNQGINEPLSELHSSYLKFCDDKKLRAEGKIEFSNQLKFHGIEIKKAHGNINKVSCDEDKLYNIFKKWIHSTDDFEKKIDEPHITKKNILHNTDDLIKYLKHKGINNIDFEDYHDTIKKLNRKIETEEIIEETKTTNNIINGELHINITKNYFKTKQIKKKEKKLIGVVVDSDKACEYIDELFNNDDIKQAKMGTGNFNPFD